MIRSILHLLIGRGREQFGAPCPFPFGAMGASICPCLGRGKEDGRELPLDGSGGDQQHGWSVKKNERNRTEDATDATGNFLPYMMAIQKQSALSRKSYPSSWAKPCERLRQAFDKADKALSEHFQKEGESNSDYGLSSGACACVALHEGLQWPTLATVTRFAAKEAHPRSSL